MPLIVVFVFVTVRMMRRTLELPLQENRFLTPFIKGNELYSHSCEGGAQPFDKMFIVIRIYFYKYEKITCLFS